MVYVLLFTLLLFFGCQKEVTVPQHLIGVWETSGPKYADCYIRITEDSLIFGVGEGTELLHTIVKIEDTQKNNGIIYTFHYKDSEGEKWTLSLLYNPDSGGAIQLQNRQEIWKKVEPGGT